MFFAAKASSAVEEMLQYSFKKETSRKDIRSRMDTGSSISITGGPFNFSSWSNSSLCARHEAPKDTVIVAFIKNDVEHS